MAIKYTLETECAPCGFEEFIKKHGLELFVGERVMNEFAKRRGVKRYWAQFRDVFEDHGQHGYSSCYENGDTPEEAIARFQKYILGKRLRYAPVDCAEPVRFVAPNEWR